MNKDKPQNNINSINHNNQELTNSSEIANAFNSFFTSIGPDLAANIDCGNIHFSTFLPRPLTNTIFLNYTNQSEIIDIVQTFKPKTSGLHTLPKTLIPFRTMQPRFFKVKNC